MGVKAWTCVLLWKRYMHDWPAAAEDPDRWKTVEQKITHYVGKKWALIRVSICIPV